MRSYRISTIAKLLCMSADAIRFFEKKKIIHPTRSPENNYRMYTLEDVRRLYDCCGFTAVGFSIREVEQIMHQLPKADMPSLLEKQEDKLRAQIRELQNALERLQRMKDGLNDPIDTVGQLTVVELPPQIFFRYCHADELDTEMMKSPLYQPVRAHRNLLTCSVVIPGMSRSAGSMEFDFDYGFTIEEAVARSYGFQLLPPVKRIRGGRRLRAVIETDAVISRADLTETLAQMVQKGGDMGKDVLCRVLDLSYDVGHEKRKYEILMALPENCP